MSDEVVARASDKSVGLRVLLVDLPGGASAVPAIDHPGVQASVVVGRLVQIRSTSVTISPYSARATP